MARSEPVRATVWEDSGATCLGRFYGNDGDAITQATLTSITCKIFDLDSAIPTTATTQTVTIASAVSDTLRTDDDRWTVDTTGFNFEHTITDDNLATGDHRYRIEYVFTPTSGENFVAVYELQCRAIVGS